MRLSVDHKSPGGLFRLVAEVKGDVIEWISIGGDFFMFPEEAIEELEERLRNTSLQREALLEKLRSFLANVEASFSAEELTEALLKLKG